MDSKQPIPSTSFDNEIDSKPPSYSESVSASTYYSTEIRSQLSTLITTVNALDTQKSLLSSAQDEKILSLLTTQIQIFISDFANSGLKKACLVLVPASGLTDENAVPTDYDFKNQDEYDRVVRLCSKEEARESLFWRDQDMAKRLAGYLSPPPAQSALPSRPVPTTPIEPTLPRPQPTGSSRSFWGRKKGTPTITSSALIMPTPASGPSHSVDMKSPDESISHPVDKGDNVDMIVKAEEVVFRTVNGFGIYGTERGWGIVLRLKVMMAEDGSRR